MKERNCPTWTKQLFMRINVILPIYDYSIRNVDYFYIYIYMISNAIFIKLSICLNIIMIIYKKFEC